jgi:hypothetical protein
MEMHIAEHLQFLMLLSLRLMETQYTDPDTASQSGSMSSMESNIRCGSRTKEDWNFDGLPSLPSSTPPRIPSPGLSESTGAEVPTLHQSTLAHRVSNKAENTVDDPSWFSSIEEVNSLPQMYTGLMESDPKPNPTGETSSQIPSTATGATMRADNTKGKGKQAASVLLDWVPVETSNPKRGVGGSRHPEIKVAWSEWGDWCWDGAQNRYWRARQNTQGMYSFYAPERCQLERDY